MDVQQDKSMIHQSVNAAVQRRNNVQVVKSSVLKTDANVSTHVLENHQLEDVLKENIGAKKHAHANA